MIIIIAAIGPNNELGLNNRLIYHSKEDMQFFKECTMGHEVIMGRKTFDSLERPLAGRVNSVVTRNPETLPEGATAVANLPLTLEARAKAFDITYVIGGASIYAQALEYAELLYLTEFEEPREADVFFPDFNRAFYEKKKIMDISGGAIYKYEYHPWKIKPNYVVL